MMTEEEAMHEEEERWAQADAALRFALGFYGVATLLDRLAVLIAAAEIQQSTDEPF